MWLAVLGEIRVLFDPLLTDLHHGGVFEVHPRREIDVAALKPDFIIVSHAHPDHFDVRSLKRLATIDPETVLLTSDAFIEQIAQRAGFRTTRRLDALQRIDLEGATLITTPPGGDVVEWGVMALTRDAIVWNQVDTQLRDANAISTLLSSLAARLERPEIARGIDLAMVCWQPLLEVAMQLGEATQFPMASWSSALEKIAAIGAKHLVPASAGSRHAAQYDEMNRRVYPVPLSRAIRDISARCQGSRVLRPEVGTRWLVEAGSVIDEGRDSIVERVAPYEDEDFAPVSIEPVRDPNLDGRDEATMQATIERWVRDELAPALTRSFATWGVHREVLLELDVVYPSTTRPYLLSVTGTGTEVCRSSHHDHDVLNVVAASMLVDVIEGRRGWGDPLLAGLLRTSFRSYDVTPRGLRRLPIAELFVYEAISYEESFRRQVEHELITCL